VSELPDIAKAADLAKHWGVKESQVYRQARDGRIPCFKVGRYYLFRRDMIEKYERGEWVVEHDEAA
jgi:excisionase family DNA binding protein